MKTITLPMPTSVNATYRTGNGNYFKTSKARDWEYDAAEWLLEQHIKQNQLKGDVYVGIEMFVKRDRDIDSGLKIVLDFLQGKFYENDKQVKHLNVKKYEDKVQPRVEVTIEEL